MINFASSQKYIPNEKLCIECRFSYYVVIFPLYPTVFFLSMAIHTYDHMLLYNHLEIVELVNILGHALPGPLDDIVLRERPGCPGVALLAALGHVHGNVMLHVLAPLPHEVLDREEEHACAVPIPGSCQAVSCSVVRRALVLPEQSHGTRELRVQDIPCL